VDIYQNTLMTSTFEKSSDSSVKITFFQTNIKIYLFMLTCKLADTWGVYASHSMYYCVYVLLLLYIWLDICMFLKPWSESDASGLKISAQEVR
jgi:hypothetical protein